MNRIVEILPNKEALIQRSLELVLAKMQSAIAERGMGTIALAGGSTPKPLYKKLAQQNLQWDKIHVFWGDERYVPPTHPDSNEGMARQAWLDQVPSTKRICRRSSAFNRGNFLPWILSFLVWEMMDTRLPCSPILKRLRCAIAWLPLAIKMDNPESPSPLL
jgi:hypothetical protein